MDFVTKASPYNLEPHSFGSNEVTQAIMRGDVRIEVDIDLEFSGLDHENAQQYKAKYEYSREHKQMVRVG